MISKYDEWMIANCNNCELRFDVEGFHCNIEESLHTHTVLPIEIAKAMGEPTNRDNSVWDCPQRRSER